MKEFFPATFANLVYKELFLQASTFTTSDLAQLVKEKRELREYLWITICI